MRKWGKFATVANTKILTLLFNFSSLVCTDKDSKFSALTPDPTLLNKKGVHLSNAATVFNILLEIAGALYAESNETKTN